MASHQLDVYQNEKGLPKEALAIFETLEVSEEQQRDIMRILNESMNKGLCPETHDEAAVKMLPSYVRSLPNGTEKGTYMSLDMGGSNFRVLLAELTDKGLKVQVDRYHLPEEILSGTADMFFGYIADNIELFMKNHCPDGTFDELPLGFTFSFPSDQHSLNSADLNLWTKGFAVKGVVGKDVVRLLQDALDKKNIKVRTVAIINDTVAALIAGAYYNNNCHIGLIIGTGINAAYMEQLSNVGTWKGDHNEPRQVVINIEMGGFGDDGVIEFVRTEIDYDLDSRTVNKGNQLVEKMISGKYLGEVARIILVKLTRLGVAFGGKLPKGLEEDWIFATSFISEIVGGDTEDKQPNSRRILQSLGADDPSPADCRLLHAICARVTQRSAMLAASLVGGLLYRLKKPLTGIAVEGSMYKGFPAFRERMTEKIAELSPDYKAEFTLVEDGPGKGSAVLAAVVARMDLDNQ
ncbi:hexokinase-2-like isoform X2 [Patiria miniata]|uniref:Phosphotransferase n=1 Tax=Patiria miniata TaxID=46514 RepID=A0A914B5Q8_PATMI|nr:hexokinase-2-like isoform X2 [Patiria miniata]